MGEPDDQPSRLLARATMFLIRVWILASTGVVGAGWVLSACHELNYGGYALVLGACLVAGLWWGHQELVGWLASLTVGWYRLRRRFRHVAPRAFLFLAGLALITGILYPPTSREESQYRTPRVLHWLAEGHWHWIHTFDIRMNIAGCGFEWLTAPLLLFTHTDRLIFLINLVSFLLLPGLVFGVLRRLGIDRRVAWWWMWLIPAGCCYALQAGNAANDAFITVYALAAVGLAMRARACRSPGDLWYSMLAVALLTSGKQTNFLLPVLWLIAAWPSLGYLRLRPGISGVVIGCALLVSALPLVSLNWWHGGNWAGVPAHPGLDWTWRWTKTELTSPFWGVIGNAFAIPTQNLAPPFFPVYEAWNQWWQHFTQTPAGGYLLQFEDFGHLSSFQAPESGLGLCLCLFLLVSLLWAGIGCNWAHSRPGLRASVQLNIRLLRLVPWGLLLIFMAKVGAYQNARHLAPYYPFLLSSILALPLFPSLVRRRLWQRLALFPMAAAAGIMVVSPVTPLFPIPATLHVLGQHFPHSKVISRCESFYATSEIEHELRRPFGKNLPPEGVVGYATTIQGQEPGLWHPFMRRVERVCPGDSLADLHQRGIDYLVVDTFYLDICGCTIAELMQRYEAQMVDQISYSRGWNRSSDYFYLIRLRAGVSKDLRAKNQ